MLAYRLCYPSVSYKLVPFFVFQFFVDECNFESVSTVVTIWYCLFVVIILSCNYVSVVVCNIVTVR